MAIIIVIIIIRSLDVQIEIEFHFNLALNVAGSTNVLNDFFLQSHMYSYEQVASIDCVECARNYV
jgi:hypothetical protein